jgi:hypothetical protein
MSEERVVNPKGRALGIVMLVVGAALLLLVFILAARTFAGLSGPAHGSGAGLESASALLAGIAARTAMLLVMAYASSLVASKGIELYAASSGRPPS